MRINIKGLINRLDDLRERLNKLFEKLEKLDDLDQEEMAIEDVEQYFQNDDTFNLSITLDVLEQVDKLDRALEIIKEKKVNVKDFYKVLSFYLLHPDCELKEYIYYNSLKTEKERLTEEEYDILKEVLL